MIWCTIIHYMILYMFMPPFTREYGFDFISRAYDYLDCICWYLYVITTYCYAPSYFDGWLYACLHGYVLNGYASVWELHGHVVLWLGIYVVATLMLHYNMKVWHYIYIYIYVYVCMCMYIYIYIHVCIYIYIYIHIYIYTHIYIHIMYTSMVSMVSIVTCLYTWLYARRVSWVSVFPPPSLRKNVYARTSVYGHVPDRVLGAVISFVCFDTAWQRTGVMQVPPSVTAPKRVRNFPGPASNFKGGSSGGNKADLYYYYY